MEEKQDLDLGIHESIITELDKPLENPEEDKKPVKTLPSWDGKTERRKIYEGEKRRASDKVDPDPEHEMDFELEEGRGRHKLKISQLKSMAKELWDNRGAYNYGLKMIEAGAKHPEFGKLVDKIVAMSFKDLKDFNPEFVTKTLAGLEGKVEKIEDEIEDKDEIIEQMQAELEDLDPESPQAKILKKSLAYQKGLKAEFKNQLAEGQKRIEALEAKLNGLETTHKNFISGQEKAEQTVEVKRLSEIYSKEIGALTDKEKKDGYKFIDDDEQKEFDAAVRNGVAANSEGVKSDEEFVKLIQATAKAVYDKIGKRRESWVNDYLKKKGKAPEKKEGEPAKESEDKDPLGGKTIGQVLADGMFANA